MDEFRPSLFTRISRAAVRMGETAWFHISKEEALPVLSAVGTFLLILLIGYGLNYASISEERSHTTSRQVCLYTSIVLFFSKIFIQTSVHFFFNYFSL